MAKLNYIPNNYRTKKIRDKYVLTTDHGEWVALDKEELTKLESKQLDEELFKRLETQGIIITEKNQEEITESLRNKNQFLFQGTSLHIIILTLRCNMNCVYCHASSKPMDKKEYDMDEETAKKTVDFIFQTPSKQIMVEFQGGEPLVNFETLKHIVEYAQKINKKYKKNLNFSVVTNLTLMDKEKLDFFIKNKITICTSLDGPKEINKKNRIFNGEEKIEHWINEINKIDKNRINALPTITKHNISYWKELIDEYIRLNLRNIHLRFLNNLGYAKKTWGNIAYSAEEFIEMWKKSIDYILELNKKGKNIKERMIFIIAQKILKNKEPNYLELRSPCGAIIGQIAYDYDGSIYTCDEARMLGDDLFKIGDVNQDMKSVIQSDKSCAVISAASNDFFCDSCAYKPYCGICPVCNYVEQGTIIGKIPVTDRCKIYKAQFDYVFEKILFDKEAKEIFEKWLTTP